MNKTAVSALLAIPSIAAASMYLTPTHKVVHADYMLVDEALVIIPVDNAEYADAAANLYRLLKFKRAVVISLSWACR